MPADLLMYFAVLGIGALGLLAVGTLNNLGILLYLIGAISIHILTVL